MARYDVRHSKFDKIKEKVVLQFKPKTEIIPQSKWDKLQLDLHNAQKDARLYKRITVIAVTTLLVSLTLFAL